MSKRPLTIFFLLLLIIGGGGVAFYLHLRAQVLPTFSEVDNFMPAFPDSMGWPAGSTRHEIKQENLLQSHHRWLYKLGVRSYGVRVTKSYHFTSIEQPNRTWTISFQTSGPGRIEDVLEGELGDLWVNGEPADVENAHRALVEKFPNLRRVLKVNP